MIIRLDNLQTGLSWFRDRWGRDLINEVYYEIYEARSGGMTDGWWTTTVDRLGKWRAYRGRRLPNTKAAIAAAGLERLPAMAALFSALSESFAGEPSIVNLNWEDVVPLFEVASSIKQGPVFPSKMCHFLFPKVFPVMDNEATGTCEYEFYWRGMKDEWLRFPKKTEAISIVTSAVESDRPLHPMYPLETKIMELSQIGYKHRCGGAWPDLLRSGADAA